MSEAGPSSATNTPISSSFAGISTASRPPRYQFPNGEHDAPRSRITRPDEPTRVASYGLGRPSLSRRAGAASGGTGSSSSQAEGIRRRVKSVDTAGVQMGSTRRQRSYEQDAEGHKRTMSTTRRGLAKGKGLATAMDSPSDFPSIPFSDEYDLCMCLSTISHFLCSDSRLAQHMKASEHSSS